MRDRQPPSHQHRATLPSKTLARALRTRPYQFETTCTVGTSGRAQGCCKRPTCPSCSHDSFRPSRAGQEHGSASAKAPDLRCLHRHPHVRARPRLRSVQETRRDWGLLLELFLEDSWRDEENETDRATCGDSGTATPLVASTATASAPPALSIGNSASTLGWASLRGRLTPGDAVSSEASEVASPSCARSR